MKKFVALILILCILIFAGGCAHSDPYADTPSPPVPSPKPLPTNNSPVSPPIVTEDEPPADRTWISPGKVNIANFYPGARAEYPLTIHNGKLEYCQFAINYRVPDYVAEGYEKAPENFGSWIIVADASPVLAPRETRDILVVVEMPENAVNAPDKWEFWITVRDISDEGMIRTVMASRWLVSMQR